MSTTIDSHALLASGWTIARNGSFYREECFVLDELEGGSVSVGCHLVERGGNLYLAVGNDLALVQCQLQQLFPDIEGEVARLVTAWQGVVLHPCSHLTT